ncbi:taurine dioxygenase [Croceicoccus estronivorus]|uniref:TauD/TfdA family dioxygenase n=1 Tax=Croceicoccus estronivorus TaxID=1172626 RepID=UPI00083443E9|nr:TauD/TfdA family dioxygenase [Croceicoccus estronivorus]OCC24494.1 taurine dioxygenase [Croceicoccus estronivorus]
MLDTVKFKPIPAPVAWRGDELEKSDEWIYVLTADELSELETVGSRFLDEDPDLRTVQAQDYPLPVCTPAIAAWGEALDRGRGFVLVRGLRCNRYSNALSASIYFVLGLHLGQPMRQNEVGDMVQHIRATSDKKYMTASSLRIRDGLTYHSDSSDVVSLLCLHPAMEGGESSLVSPATLYNEVLARRPDLVSLLFEPWHFDWRQQDPDAPANTYTSPMLSYVDGVFSAYLGNAIIRRAQDMYPEIPRLTAEQVELMDLIDAICLEPGVALHMDFRQGDMQWVLNYAALHNRKAFKDAPEPELRRHLLRLWLKRDTPRPLVPNFGRHVVKGRGETRGQEVPLEKQRFHITQAAIPRIDWGY